MMLVGGEEKQQHVPSTSSAASELSSSALGYHVPTMFSQTTSKEAGLSV